MCAAQKIAIIVVYSCSVIHVFLAGPILGTIRSVICVFLSNSNGNVRRGTTPVFHASQKRSNKENWSEREEAHLGF